MSNNTTDNGSASYPLPNSIHKLQKIWEKDKEEYKGAEIGSGVQDFVYSAFQSSELFNLKKGILSTPQENRDNEFLCERGNKAGRADAVIFINQYIIVPVEVEKFENIKGGEWQILKYRTAFDKKYGILTDGSDWRFYYGDIEESQYYLFTIKKMFEDPARFRDFWQEYIRPENYYLSFFEDIGQQKFAFAKSAVIPVDTNRGKFFDDVTEIIGKLKNKLLNAGYFEKLLVEHEKQKKATEIAYSYLIQFILYKTLVDNSFPTFADEFAKKEKLIHSNLKKGSYNYILIILEGMGTKISENIYKPFHQEQSLIIEQVKTIVEEGNETLMNVSPFLDIFFFIRKYNFANVQNDIFGAIYENYLKVLYEENLGQYFTAPEVVNFMLEEVGYTAEEIKKRNHENISIIDPSCGSGTFLYSAVRELIMGGGYVTQEESKRIEDEINNNVFGLDIAEFPLYLAEMSVLMKLLPIVVNEKYNNPIDKKLKFFVTEDSISEFIHEIGGRASSDGAGEQGRLALAWQYEGFMRDENDLDEMKKSLNTVGSGAKAVARRRFDFVVGNPPYIAYNECSRSGVKIFNQLKDKNSSVSLNDIYGWNLHSAHEKRKKYSPKPNLYSFFMALGFALLKPGGRFCYIIPQTLLYLPDLDVVRYYLSNVYTIEKIITFAGNLFIGRGTNQNKKVPTSSLIIVCCKEKPNKSHEVECVHYDGVNEEVVHIFNKLHVKRSIYSKFIPQAKLKESADNWSFIKWDKAFLCLYEKYGINSESIDVYYNHSKAESRFGKNKNFYFDVGYSLDQSLRVKAPTSDDYLLIPERNSFVNYTHYVFSNKDSYYPKSEIALTQNSQGLITIEKRYKIIWSINGTDKFYFTELPIVFAMAVYGIISSDDKEELLFLFSILNSKLTMNILFALFKVEEERAYSFTAPRIKTFVRTPLIDTPEKEKKKRELIKITERMLDMEKMTIGDLTETNTLMRRFDDAKVVGNELLLIKGTTECKCRVKTGAEKLIRLALDNARKDDLFADKGISITELRDLPAFDRGEQMKLKGQIDTLVYELYGLTDEEIGIVEEAANK